MLLQSNLREASPYALAELRVRPRVREAMPLGVVQELGCHLYAEHTVAQPSASWRSEASFQRHSTSWAAPGSGQPRPLSCCSSGSGRPHIGRVLDTVHRVAACELGGPRVEGILRP
eukprot:scaffold46155_cov60-Phaeocystis_antarctica.AAC.1